MKEYINKIKDKPHAIMFHHFSNGKNKNGQGAITASQLESIIEYYRYNNNLLSAKEWFEKAKANLLNRRDVCLTFDDTLLCQYEIGLPVLKKYGLTAFWFIYSSVLCGGVEKFEIYRKFRSLYFDSINSFYDRFFFEVKKSNFGEDVEISLKKHCHDDWKEFPFYSQNDTKFRYVRDTSLGPDKYDYIMNAIMKDYEINLNELISDLWMNSNHITKLHNEDHIIGLHSHTHSMILSKLSAAEQEKEYEDNIMVISSIIGEKPKTVSHPCNQYNKQTLSILTKLGIEIGFRANMENHMYSMFEFPREDHANVLRRIDQ